MTSDMDVYINIPYMTSCNVFYINIPNTIRLMRNEAYLRNFVFRLSCHAVKNDNHIFKEFCFRLSIFLQYLSIYQICNKYKRWSVGSKIWHGSRYRYVFSENKQIQFIEGGVGHGSDDIVKMIKMHISREPLTLAKWWSTNT